MVATVVLTNPKHAHSIFFSFIYEWIFVCVCVCVYSYARVYVKRAEVNNEGIFR